MGLLDSFEKGLERAVNRGTLEFLKALAFIFLGYGWAAAAYGHLPIG